MPSFIVILIGGAVVGAGGGGGGGDTGATCLFLQLQPILIFFHKYFGLFFFLCYI
jgi:hypothetical protein